MKTGSEKSHYLNRQMKQFFAVKKIISWPIERSKYAEHINAAQDLEYIHILYASKKFTDLELLRCYLRSGLWEIKQKHWKILQAVSLHESMSIFENFFFYGYVFGMSSRAIQARAIDLITLLDLPSGHRIVGDLRYVIWP